MATILYMAKPGRRLATPADYKEALALRIKYARELKNLSHVDIAKLLTVKIGRKITPDTYRKWETTASSIAHDAILPFCDITQTHPYALLASPSDTELQDLATGRRRSSAA